VKSGFVMRQINLFDELLWTSGLEKDFKKFFSIGAYISSVLE
jgi:hypothetical protein